MPMLAVHLSLVQEVVDTLGVDELRENMGAALLGSTTPDRRVMTRESREETHYFSLADGKVGDGFRGMKEALPEMSSRAPDSDWTLTAFLIGYASHLAADEAWVVDVYRPYFGDEKYLGGEPARNILDRAVQFEMELDVRTDAAQLREWQKLVSASDSIIASVPTTFIPYGIMRGWAEYVGERVLTMAADWAAFPRFIGRYLDGPGLDEAAVQELVAEPESMLGRVYETVPREVIEGYRAIAVKQSLEHAVEILS